MLQTVRAVAITAKWFLFLFKQIMCVTDSQSGRDRFLFAVDYFSSIARFFFRFYRISELYIYLYTKLLKCKIEITNFYRMN